MSKDVFSDIPKNIPTQEIRSLAEWDEEFGELIYEPDCVDRIREEAESPEVLLAHVGQQIIESRMKVYFIHPGALGDPAAFINSAIPAPGSFHADSPGPAIHTLYYPRNGEIENVWNQLPQRKAGTRFIPIDDATDILMQGMRSHLLSAGFPVLIQGVRKSVRHQDCGLMFDRMLTLLREFSEGNYSIAKHRFFNDVFAPLQTLSSYTRLWPSALEEEKDEEFADAARVTSDFHSIIQKFTDSTLKRLTAMGILIRYPAGRMVLYDDSAHVHATEIIKPGQDLSTVHYREPFFRHPADVEENAESD